MHTSTPEKLDDGSVVVEATTVEAALEEATTFLGSPDAEVQHVERIQRGGIGGFFARELLRVTVALPEPEADEPAPVPPPSASPPPVDRVAPGVVEARPSGVDATLARLAAMEDEREATFGDVLRGQLEAPALRTTPDRTAEQIVRDALARARAAAPPAEEPAVSEPRRSDAPDTAEPGGLPASLLERMRAWHDDDELADVPSGTRVVAPLFPQVESSTDQDELDLVAGHDLDDEPTEDIDDHEPFDEVAVVAGGPVPSSDDVGEDVVDAEIVEEEVEGDHVRYDEVRDLLVALPGDRAATPGSPAPLGYTVAAPSWLGAVTTSEDVPAPRPAAAPATVVASALAEEIATVVAELQPQATTQPAAADAPVAEPSLDPVVAAEPPRVAIGAGAAGACWDLESLRALRLPEHLVDACRDLDPDDELSWLTAIAAAVEPWCGPEPDGTRALVGPRSHWQGDARGIPSVSQGEAVPAEGDVALKAWDHVGGEAWVADSLGERWIEVVISPDGWRRFVGPQTRVVSWIGARHLVDALTVCAEHPGVVLGSASDAVPGEPTRRVGPLDVALAIRALLPRRNPDA